MLMRRKQKILIGSLVICLSKVHSTPSHIDAPPENSDYLVGHHPVCFVGDVSCQHDAFDFAGDLLDESSDLLLVVSGRINSVEGMPDTILIRRDVQANFIVDWIHRYQDNIFDADWMHRYERSIKRAQVAHGYKRHEGKDLGEVGFGERKLILDDGPFLASEAFIFDWVGSVLGAPTKTITIQLTSDMFLWPETGTSRIVARRILDKPFDEGRKKFRQEIAELDRRLEASLIDADEYRAAESDLKARLRRLLASQPQRQLDGVWKLSESSARTRRSQLIDVAGGAATHTYGGSFTHHRGGALEVGARYLFALRERINGAADSYHFRDFDDWKVFWGDEMREVDWALHAIHNCHRMTSILHDPKNGVHAGGVCVNYARGLARGNDIRRRH